MKTLHTIEEFRAYRRGLPAQGGEGGEGAIAFVPTMGALHEGHASLVRAARRLAGTAGTVCASIFVNPTQFGPGEDFSRYPRTLDADGALLNAAGCDAVFAPAAQEMYPQIQQLNTQHSMLSTSVDPGPLAKVLEGAIRPGHFRGVCTVVAKLLNIVEPTHLLLGQKDYQQQAILRHMCADLNMAVEVLSCPTVREADGLAMSSRNRYLSADERVRAVALYEALAGAKKSFAGGETSAKALEAGMETRLMARGLSVQYAVVVHAETLARFGETAGGKVELPAVVLIAAKLGATRLIDNFVL